MEIPFIVGNVYSRRRDIHGCYKGQQQGGISTPAGVDFVFLFTGESGARYGYRDEFRKDGTFWLTGEGQKGNMQMVRGNLAIQNHVADGKRLLLFEAAQRSTVRFMGEAFYIGHHWEQRLDIDFNLRKAIVFELDVNNSPTPSPRDTESAVVLGQKEKRLWSLPMTELRELANLLSPSTANPQSRRQAVRIRSEAVRVYVLRRAQGICECCDRPAPFKTPKKKPYLEPHHIKRLADDGPDHPAFVGAVCPNCHREIHHGAAGKILNENLARKVATLEGF